MTTTLLITGSRQATTDMIARARAMVAAAKARGWVIIVGDAEGVDAAVMDEADRLGVRHIICGANGTLRRKTATGSTTAIDGDYLARDRFMVDNAMVVWGVWNGHSRGTAYTCNYAKRTGKPVFLENYGGKA